MRRFAPAAVLLACLALLAASRTRVFDLDVALPPGSPLEWTASFPAYTPARAPLFARTVEEPAGDARTVSRPAHSDVDVRFANAFGQVRILTWDLVEHLPWTKGPKVPATGRIGLRPEPPSYGDPLYWLALAPLLRLLLHPDALSRAETLAHLVELGEPTLAVLAAAAPEKDLAPDCRTLHALIRADEGPEPTAPPGATPRATGFARFVLEECLRAEPEDPCADFGKRLFLFSAEAEPLLIACAQGPSLALARNAVAALGRYETRTALQFLAQLAARAEDPVTLVRALAGVGRYRGPLDVAPLVERLRHTDDPVLRASLIGALGHLGARDALAPLLELGERARTSKDSDLMISVLSALARIPPVRRQPELIAFCERVTREAKEIAGHGVDRNRKPDLPDPPALRAEILTQLALLARSQADPLDDATRAAILALPRPAPLDARLSERGLGGTDPLGGIAPPVRVLYLEGLLRAGPEGLEELAALARRAEVDTVLRGRALSLLPYDQRLALGAALLADRTEPVELRIQALEVALADAHPRAAELCRAELTNPRLAEPRAERGEQFLALRAVRHLSEAGRLKAAELLPLWPYVQRPPALREAALDELRRRLLELAEHARAGARDKALEEEAGALFDFVLEHGLNPLLDADARAPKIDALLAVLAAVRGAHKDPELAGGLVPVLLAQLVGGEIQVDDPGRTLFRPDVPLGEELVLALGRTREKLALELLLTLLHQRGSPLRAHACLALGMCVEPAVARELLPFLLDEDGFVRFAAAESLRELVGKELAIDWMHAPFSARFAAATEFRQWFLDRKPPSSSPR